MSVHVHVSVFCSYLLAVIVVDVTVSPGKGRERGSDSMELDAGQIVQQLLDHFPEPGASLLHCACASLPVCCSIQNSVSAVNRMQCNSLCTRLHQIITRATFRTAT